MDITIPTPAAPTLVITDDKHLTNIVFDLANTQLIITRAETDQAARVEAIKMATDEALAAERAKLAEYLAAVETYAEKHKDRLFSKKKKTFTILQHKLQYRASSSVKTPEDEVAVIRNLISNKVAEVIDLDPDGEEAKVILATITGLKVLLRQPAEELNKDAVKTLLNSSREGLQKLKELVAAAGFKVDTSESFKVELTFTPDQTAQAA